LEYAIDYIAKHKKYSKLENADKQVMVKSIIRNQNGKWNDLLNDYQKWEEERLNKNKPIKKTEPAPKSITETINELIVEEDTKDRICPICKGTISKKDKFCSCENGCGSYIGDKFTEYENVKNVFIRNELDRRKKKLA